MSQISLPKFILRHKDPRKDGTCAIYLQLIIERHRKTFKTFLSVLPSEWDQASEKVNLPKSRKEEENLMNFHLQNQKSKVVNAIQRFHYYDRPLTMDALLKELDNSALNRSFIAYFEKSIPSINVKGPTIIVYNTVLKRLKEFKPEILFHDLNYELLKDFETWAAKKYKLGTNTIHKYLKTVKTFINLAVKEGIPIDESYDNYKLKKKKGYREWLSHDEINLLIKLYNETELGYRIKESLAAFLFSACGGGYRISDITKFTQENIINNEIIFQAEKTSTSKGFRRVKLTDVATALIKYKPAKLFHTNKHAINYDLKEIAIMAGIKKHLTFHVARHTFATHYLVNGGQAHDLQHILGHSKIDQTMEYVHIVNEQKNQRMHLMNKYDEIITSYTSAQRYPTL